MPKITANFSSVDMATLAVKSVTSHLKGVDSVKINYHKKPVDTYGLTSSMFLPAPITNGLYTNETQPYPIMFGDRPSNELQIEGDVRIEMLVTNCDLQAVKANLRRYGGLGVKVLNN